MEELRARLEGLEGEAVQNIVEVLRAIELGVCEAERRGAALEQVEPAARRIRARLAETDASG